MLDTASALLDLAWWLDGEFRKDPWSSLDVVEEFDDLWPQLHAAQQWVASNVDRHEKVQLLSLIHI